MFVRIPTVKYFYDVSPTIFFGSLLSLYLIPGVFYLQGNLAPVDTVLAVMGLYVGVMDGYLCWHEGRPRMGMLRSACAFVVAALGMAGCPAGGQGRAWRFLLSENGITDAPIRDSCTC